MNAYTVTFRPSPSSPCVVVELDHSKADWAEVCEAARRRLFPGVAVVEWVPEVVEIVKPERKRRRK